MASRLLGVQETDPETPDSSQQEGVGLTLGNTVTPTTLTHLALSIEDLESQEDAAVPREPSDIESRQSGSNDTCS